MTRSGVPTRAERVYSALRADILAGRLRPGDRLPFTELSAQYGASMGVVREALTRLAAEGLVEAQPQYGFRVTPVSAEDLRDLTEARCAIETLVLRQAFAHGGVEWETRVVATHHRLQRTPQMAPDDPERLSDEWLAAHRAFHTALLDGCPNRRLRAVAASLHDAAELYRSWSVSLTQERRDIPGEHRALLDAVVAGDADAGVAALTAHIQRTTATLIAGAELSDAAPA
ncbi:DNA-binding transcriptional regulator, GntR family [Pseudonocardia thermophila]|jgi:Transcriptional regulators|uniref:DNA-binding transcriptional regulator, GntR family n=1 Tax=Pseudonocardia thermophila TaxID=1848 RepID=A0A1M6V3C0_PSETH|nr:DNA-binding transcriptional regulator, GntR family [Pseudonocardia thermophila]